MNPRSPTVKLCGLCSEADVRAAVAAGADHVGIVLVPGTRRSVSGPDAASMVLAARATARELGRPAPEVVGVIAPMPAGDGVRLVAETGVDAVQLVGDDDGCVQLADALTGVPLIRSIGVAEHTSFAAARARTEQWVARGARIAYDAQVDGVLGGTGQRIAPGAVRPLLAAGRHGLAGGLHPGNVAEAIRAMGPAMVDVSSGIESPAGHKDAALMRSFVAAARGALITEPETTR